MGAKPDFADIDRPAVEAPADGSLEQLQRLHKEAFQTAHLANLLGRTPGTIGLLVTISAGAIFLTGARTFPALVSALLMATGIGALGIAYGKANRSPFANASLRVFARQLDAAMFYLGLAWGAGGFLILPREAEPAVGVLFCTAAPAALAFVVREQNPVLMFMGPAVTLTAIAAFVSPFRFPGIAAGMVILSGAIMAGTLLLTRSIRPRESLQRSESYSG